jgi:hypothetical protein
MAGRIFVLGGLSRWFAVVAAINMCFSYGAADLASSHASSAMGLRPVAKTILHDRDSAAASVPAMHRLVEAGSPKLRLRGGGEMVHPTVWWSQRSNSLLIKVDMPAGVHEAKGLSVEEKKLVWKAENIVLEHELFEEIDTKSVRVMNDG